MLNVEEPLVTLFEVFKRFLFDLFIAKSLRFVHFVKALNLQWGLNKSVAVYTLFTM